MTPDTLVTVLLALLSGTGGWGVLQFVLNRVGRKAEAARQMADTERIREDAKTRATERLALVAEMERKAYDKGQEAADKRYGELKTDYADCRRGLNELRVATEALIDAIDAIIARAQPLNGEGVTVTVTREEITSVRAAIRSARSHLN